MSGDRYLTGPEVAAQLGILPSSWRSQTTRKRTPPPDDPDEGRPPNRREPRWLQSTIDAYIARNDKKEGS